ncbi:hypothetical protein ABK040_005927 [Willaertia magna]
MKNENEDDYEVVDYRYNNQYNSPFSRRTSQESIRLNNADDEEDSCEIDTEIVQSPNINTNNTNTNNNSNNSINTNNNTDKSATTPTGVDALLYSRHSFVMMRKIEETKKNENENQKHHWRYTLYLLLEQPRHSKLSLAINLFISFLVIVSVIILILESFFYKYQIIWWIFDGVLSFIFTIEFILRMMANIYNLKDFIKMPHKSDVELEFLSMFKVLRLLRLIKLAKYSIKIQLLIVSIRRSIDLLLAVGFFILSTIIIFGSIIYYSERGIYDSETQRFVTVKHLNGTEIRTPSVFSDVTVGMWYALVSMTTTGYGDISPTSGIGRIIGSLTILSGVLIIALPSMIIGRVYGEVVQIYEEAKEKEKREEEEKKRQLEELNNVNPELAEQFKEEELKRKREHRNVHYYIESQDFNFHNWNEIEILGLIEQQEEKINETMKQLRATRDILVKLKCKIKQ